MHWPRCFHLPTQGVASALHMLSVLATARSGTIAHPCASHVKRATHGWHATHGWGARATAAHSCDAPVRCIARCVPSVIRSRNRRASQVGDKVDVVRCTGPAVFTCPRKVWPVHCTCFRFWLRHVRVPSRSMCIARETCNARMARNARVGRAGDSRAFVRCTCQVHRTMRPQRDTLSKTESVTAWGHVVGETKARGC